MVSSTMKYLFNGKTVDIPDNVKVNTNVFKPIGGDTSTTTNDPNAGMRTLYQNIFNKSSTLKQKNAVSDAYQKATGESLFKTNLTSAKDEETAKKFGDIARSTDLLVKNYQNAEVKGPGTGDAGLLLSNITRGAIYPHVNTYEGLRKSLIGPLARAISGEVGVLTDRDIARAEGLLPKINDAPEVVNEKLTNLRTMIESKGGPKSSSGGGEDINNLRKKYNY